ncbi:MAG: phosphatidate cytidylyltransferase [Deltaproteobacteria bacterium]|jgi:phosphatidate cytidylyltransferase|nr:MAG: phosphatidate cytidylyltransferase [Deltaproteobacteria bacterium]
MEKKPVDKFHLQRWLTAAVALPLLGAIIGLGPFWLLLVLILLVSAGGLLELSGLLLARSRPWLRVVTLSVGLTLPLATYWKGGLGLTAATATVLFITLSAHLLLYAKKEAVSPSLGAVVFTQLYIPFLLSHVLLLFLLPFGRRWIFFVLFVVFAGDTGAYYTGYRWGRHKLWPAVSPGKTIEGALGGLFSSLVIGVIFGKLLFTSAGITVGFLLVLATALALVGQTGDLVESMLKRVSQVKDSSGLLPGHGGLLDRLDSLIFAFPLTYYGLIFFA